MVDTAYQDDAVRIAFAQCTIKILMHICIIDLFFTSHYPYARLYELKIFNSSRYFATVLLEI